MMRLYQKATLLVPQQVQPLLTFPVPASQSNRCFSPPCPPLLVPHPPSPTSPTPPPPPPCLVLALCHNKVQIYLLTALSVACADASFVHSNHLIVLPVIVSFVPTVLFVNECLWLTICYVSCVPSQAMIAVASGRCVSFISAKQILQ